jgi:hypothetical protein
MKNSQRGSSVLLAILTVLLLLVIAGGFVSYFFNKNKKPIIQATAPTEVSTPQKEPLFGGSSGNFTQNNYQVARLAIENKADTLFNNATSKPEIKIGNLPTNSKNSINAKRQKVNEIFKTNSTSLSAGDMAFIISYLNDLRQIVASLSPDNSNLSQTQINNYQAVVNNAQTDIQATITPASPTGNEILPDSLSPFDRFGRPRLIEGPNRN